MMGFLRNLFAGGVPEPTAGVDCDCTAGYGLLQHLRRVGG